MVVIITSVIRIRSLRIVKHNVLCCDGVHMVKVKLFLSMSSCLLMGRFAFSYEMSILSGD